MIRKRIVLLAMTPIMMGVLGWASEGNAALFSPQEADGMHSPDSAPTLTNVPAFSVCVEGCDFRTIQDALDDPPTLPGSIIEIMDPVHTEAGITVSKDVTIRGQGAELTVVQAHASMADAPDRVFYIAEQADVTIRDMTIRHGNPQVDEDWRMGGGILNKGTLLLERCIVTQNTGNTGGGILTIGPLTVDGCIISSNTADRIAPDGWDDGDGGGIEVDVGGSLLLINSTVSENFAEFNGGGVYVDWNCPTTIINSTLSNNRSVTHGGGLYIKAETYVINATITGNRATGLPAINQIGVRTPRDDVHTGGGVYVRGPLHFTNTIIANNTKKDCSISPPDGYGVGGTLGINEYNLIEDGSCVSQFTGNPLLSGMAANLAGTMTQALLPGSPAIDAAPIGAADVVVDQRGLPRPVPCGFAETPVDLGAYEVQADECVLPALEASPTTRPPTSAPSPPSQEPIPALEASPTARPSISTPSPPSQEPIPDSQDGLDALLLLILVGGAISVLVGAIMLWKRHKRS